MTTFVSHSLHRVGICVALALLAIPIHVSSAQTTTEASSTPTLTATSSTSFAPAGIITSRFQARITNLAANMSTRLENTAQRFEQIIGRIESRIDILKGTGVVTSPAEAELEKAKTSLTAAKAALVNIDTKVRDVVMASNMQADWPTLRTTYSTARTNLVDTHSALTSSIALLKKAIGTKANESTATSSLPITQ